MNSSEILNSKSKKCVFNKWVKDQNVNLQRWKKIFSCTYYENTSWYIPTAIMKIFEEFWKNFLRTFFSLII